MTKPTIAITMGDASGIGPEIVVKVLSQGAVHSRCSPFVIGDPEVMAEARSLVGADLRFRPVESVSQATFSPSEVDVLRPPGLNVKRRTWGALDPALGEAAALCLRTAFDLAMESQVDGVVSAPMNKEAFHLAGYDYADELEYLAEYTKSPDTFMAGVMDSVWSVTVTQHLAFRSIPDYIVKDRVLDRIEKLHRILVGVGTAEPRIAVAALNVHAGEGGLYGREELDEIGPAIEEARRRGIAADGPIPADMVFVRALEGDYDGVVSMYHDQANIARKLHARRRGATIFMGLLVPCGTTAHGTAFDIAGKGIAEPGSLSDALEYVIRLASERPE